MPKSLEGKLPEMVILGPHFPFINEQTTKQKTNTLLPFFSLKIGFDGCNNLSSQSSEKKSYSFLKASKPERASTEFQIGLYWKFTK